MPNLKIYVEEAIWTEHRHSLAVSLGPTRSMLCEQLNVDVSACQLALLPVVGLPDQAPINVEISVLSRPERTRQMLEAVCRTLQEQISEAADRAKTVVRCNGLDPQCYLSLK